MEIRVARRQHTLFDRPMKNENNKYELLINDYVINPELCNFKCNYCLSNHSPVWISDFDGSQKKLSQYLLGEQVEKTLMHFDEVFDYPILRISGGEILIYSDFLDFLDQCSKKYEAVQVLTNGYFLSAEIVDHMNALGNIYVHISLDGHLYEMNSYRVKSLKQHQRLMSNLEYALESNLKIEIGSVLTDRNTANYVSFLDYLNGFDNKVVVYPFPVRGETLEQFVADEKSAACFSEILEKYEDYLEILPPRSFMNHVVSNILGNDRVFSCHLPKTTIQTFNSGDVTPCLNLWMNKVGNIHTDSKMTIHNEIQNQNIYKIFNQNRPRLKYCKHCITSLDVISLYLSDKISLEEINKIPLYSGEQTQNRMNRFKKILNENGN